MPTSRGSMLDLIDFSKGMIDDVLQLRRFKAYKLNVAIVSVWILRFLVLLFAWSDNLTKTKGLSSDA